MTPRWGPGPVFAYEWLARARRWQGYAARAGFLLGILAALALVRSSMGTAANLSAAQLQAIAGRQFSHALALTQLALVMLAAPAATAGAICLDRARGSLAHALVTDLSDAEIVLGKLAARLVSVLGLVACALPVAALGTLLGGIDPRALTGSFLACAGLAVLGCTLALALSNWLAKTHEVLTVVFAIWTAWLLAWPVVEGMFGWSPYWVKASHPIWAIFAPYSVTGATWHEPVLFFLACLLASAVLATVAVMELRPAYRRQLGRKPKVSGEDRAARRSRRGVRWWPHPSLDRNPVLWREWHRARPALVIRIIWWLYIGISSSFSLRVIWDASWHHRTWGPELVPFLNAIQVTFGLLLLSLSAATALAEERVRGSLDVLLATPLPTKAIVWGKWWGVYRWVPLLAIWPFLVNLSLAWTRGTTPQSIHAIYLVPASILAHGAAITGLGLALASWTPRLGRAVAGTVAAFVFMTVAWPIVGLMSSGQADRGLVLLHVQGSPFCSVAILTSPLEYGGPANAPAIDSLAGGATWLIIYALVAGGLLLLTLATFNECLGRVDEVPRPAWLRGSGSRTPGAGGRPGSDGESCGRPPR